jgi:septum formation protein
MRLILASASPRRADLLRAAGLAFETMSVGVDERAHAGEMPEAYVRRLAAAKSSRALEQLRGSPETGPNDAGVDVHVILGADTVVVVDGELFGKPRDAGDARRMIDRLSGRRHDVLTGVSLRHGDRELDRVAATAVFFAPMSTADVDWYVRTGEGLDKAGGYAIQGLASRFVERIEGSYSNVVGLPVALIYALLGELGGLGGLGRLNRASADLASKG